MTSRAATEFHYKKLTWPEINDAIELNKVCIIPCGAVEQHGPHQQKVNPSLQIHIEALS